MNEVSTFCTCKTCDKCKQNITTAQCEELIKQAQIG